MRKARVLFIVIIFVLGISNYVCATPNVSAKACVLMELNSGRILYSKNKEQRLPMASTTKIMTALVALETKEDRLEETIEITESMSGIEGSSMYLQTGEKMTLKELLYGLMLVSGNDAAVAIAESVGGSVDKFVALMNQKAMEHNLLNTHFANPNGLPCDDHYSTAEDMANMTRIALMNSNFAEIVKTKTYKVQGEGKAYPRVLSNHNKLLNMYEGCVGVKTGFTKAAGRCLVSAAEKEGMILICVTLNAPDDWNDHINMCEYGFKNYKLYEIADRKKPIASIEVNGAGYDTIPIYSQNDVKYPVKEGEKIVSEIEVYPEISAPIEAEEEIGKLRISYPTGEISESPLVTFRNIEIERSNKGIKNEIKKVFHLFFTIMT